ncbi:hypothetical protein PMAYCL1PPCAC_25601, partial [Pristionchus mayeri]
MTDNSKLVLRWEINNSTADHAEGNAESEMLNQEGYKWIASFEKRNDNVFADFFLECGVDHTGQWKCEADVKYSLLYTSGMKTNHEKSVQSFNVNDKFIVSFEIHITSADSDELFADPDMFAVPNNKSNVILKIGGKDLHVSKEFLAVHSPVFDEMFFGDFAEKEKEEVEIKDVVYEEFLDLLHLLYREIEISDRTVPHILKLADRFQMTDLLKESENHLTHSNGIGEAKKLLLADQYRLTSLKVKIHFSIHRRGMVHVLFQSTPEYANFSADLKVAICDRIMELYIPIMENPTFVFRWEINNASSAHAARRVESEVFDNGGFKWFAFARTFCSLCISSIIEL